MERCCVTLKSEITIKQTHVTTFLFMFETFCPHVTRLQISDGETTLKSHHVYVNYDVTLSDNDNYKQKGLTLHRSYWSVKWRIYEYVALIVVWKLFFLQRWNNHSQNGAKRFDISSRPKTIQKYRWSIHLSIPETIKFMIKRKAINLCYLSAIVLTHIIIITLCLSNDTLYLSSTPVIANFLWQLTMLSISFWILQCCAIHLQASST